MGVKPVKSETDSFWNDRAASVKNEIDVNTKEFIQRELEYDSVSPYLSKEMKVLEVGCGNGYSTARFRTLVKWVDAVDNAENMIERALSTVGETNNRFILENILNPLQLKEQYDTVICIRVLINLQNLHEQKLAIGNLARFTKPDGSLILFEGFSDGFSALTELRKKIGLPPMEPAKINCYSPCNEIVPEILKYFTVKERFHLGSYDFLTRIVYPLFVGPENVSHNTDFSKKSLELARQYNPGEFEHFSRMRGFLLEKRRG